MMRMTQNPPMTGCFRSHSRRSRFVFAGGRGLRRTIIGTGNLPRSAKFPPSRPSLHRRSEQCAAGHEPRLLKCLLQELGGGPIVLDDQDITGAQIRDRPPHKGDPSENGALSRTRELMGKRIPAPSERVSILDSGEKCPRTATSMLRFFNQRCQLIGT